MKPFRPLPWKVRLHSQIRTFFLTLDLRCSLGDWWADSPQLPNSEGAARHVWFEGIFPMYGGKPAAASLTEWLLREGPEAFGPRKSQVSGQSGPHGLWLHCSHSYRYSPRKEHEEQWHDTTAMVLSPAYPQDALTYVPVTSPLPAMDWIDLVPPTRALPTVFSFFLN